MPKNKLIDELSSSAPVYTQDDFVFCKKPNGDITSCGFRIDSTLMKNSESPFVMYTNSSDTVDERSHVADIFRNKTVPMGIYHASSKRERYPVDMDDDISDMEISDDLYEKLLGLVDVSSHPPKKNLTKKTKRANSHRKTKSKRVDKK